MQTFAHMWRHFLTWTDFLRHAKNDFENCAFCLCDRSLFPTMSFHTFCKWWSMIIEDTHRHSQTLCDISGHLTNVIMSETSSDIEEVSTAWSQNGPKLNLGWMARADRVGCSVSVFSHAHRKRCYNLIGRERLTNIARGRSLTSLTSLNSKHLEIKKPGDP